MSKFSFRLASLIVALILGLAAVMFWESNLSVLTNVNTSDIESSPVVKDRTFSPQMPKAEAIRLAEEENAAEVVFRFQLKWNKQLKVCFLLLNGKEPSEEFLSRFKGQTEPRIQRLSRKIRDQNDKTVDSETGEEAEIISVSPIKWISQNEVEVRSNVYDGDVGEYVHTLTRQGEGWIIEDWRGLDWDETPKK